MALGEGIRRIRVVGKTVLTAGLVLIGVLLTGLIGSAFTRTAFGLEPLFRFCFFGIPLSIVGGVILLAGWIVEGFAIPGQPPRP
jgi:hypothetical protein